MTGPEHYQAAERLISAARSPKGRAEEDATTLLAGQVHATLALAAAVAFSADMTAGEWPGWEAAAASEQTKRDVS